MKKYLLLIPGLLWLSALRAQENPCPDKGIENADTTIILKSGTELTFNRCDFFDIKDCMELYEIRNLEDLQSRGLTTMDISGDILLTCGMFVLQFNHSEDCENKDCLDHPVRIRIPVLPNPCMGTFRGNNELYRSNLSNRWEKVEGGNEVTNNKGQRYLEFSTRCGGGFNCDKKLPGYKVKFKAKELKRALSVNVSARCPILNLTYFPKGRKNIVIAKLPCHNPDSLMVTVKGINQAGDTVNISQPLNGYFPRYTRSHCPVISKAVKRRILGIFPLYERNVYRKYLVR